MDGLFPALIAVVASLCMLFGSFADWRTSGRMKYRLPSESWINTPCFAIGNLLAHGHSWGVLEVASITLVLRNVRQVT
jgi:hypothetical protein